MSYIGGMDTCRTRHALLLAYVMQSFQAFPKQLGTNRLQTWLLGTSDETFSIKLRMSTSTMAGLSMFAAHPGEV